MTLAEFLDYLQSFGKGYRVIRRAEFLEEVRSQVPLPMDGASMFNRIYVENSQNYTRTHAHVHNIYV